MSKNRFVKSVSFNKTNEEDQLILKNISRRNFSGYVKKLILEDIKQKQGNKSDKTKNEGEKDDIQNDKSVMTPQPKQSPSDRLEQLKKRSQQSAPKVFINQSKY
ncbi:hypothetical protein [Desertibacillus haloalkaliphilus]|uniref:hypothetical protein n=1 Tax=Desertibacillus haloalkaliphilus TaxID=1328930 RepID=UPI001C25B239|nr:hypothetical protein [Desertibacillus haloalkaliphilus]MBU8908468.1 hypothetical protein [Desertibacillus haloalkaliphilus]